LECANLSPTEAAPVRCLDKRGERIETMTVEAQPLSADLLRREIETHTMKVAFVSVRHLPELKDDIESLWEAGQLDGTFYRKHLSRFQFSVPQAMPEARTILIIASPEPQVRVPFVIAGKTHLGADLLRRRACSTFSAR
jgi:hypothetical protein